MKYTLSGHIIVVIISCDKIMTFKVGLCDVVVGFLTGCLAASLLRQIYSYQEQLPMKLK